MVQAVGRIRTDNETQRTGMGQRLTSHANLDTHDVLFFKRNYWFSQHLFVKPNYFIDPYRVAGASVSAGGTDQA